MFGHHTPRASNLGQPQGHIFVKKVILSRQLFQVKASYGKKDCAPLAAKQVRRT
jgi:hypothetical protein